jgi:hypothetical protein
MSTAAQNLTRQAVDRAEPLAFPSKRSAVVHVTYRGVPVDVSMEGANVAEVEKLIGSLLERDGWAAPAGQGGNTARAERAPAVEPVYQPDGTPCCPHHLRPLKSPNQWGKLYCSAKDDAGQYCKYTTKA